MVAALRSTYGEATIQPTLNTIGRVLGNVLRFPNDTRYRSLSVTTKAYTDKIAAYSEAKELLHMAGFEQVGSSMVLKRNDMALLWLL